MIFTRDAESVVKLFEALGFEKRHNLAANTGRLMIVANGDVTT